MHPDAQPDAESSSFQRAQLAEPSQSFEGERKVASEWDGGPAPHPAPPRHWWAACSSAWAYLFIYFKLELIYNVVLISAAQNDLVIHIYTYIYNFMYYFPLRFITGH